MICRDLRTGDIGTSLTRPYFGLGRVDFPDTTDFQLPYGEWLSLFGRWGLRVEKLLETRPSPGRPTSYLDATEARWAESWPLEVIWSLRKGSATGP
jgi:hypothetical protein